ncbi:MAG: hypothetical protein K2O36_03495 [Ruminococcus sp.]|nr:hypothetical protein [Ruminococcus sp.]MDE7104928.1 hypothetical protein [Ruminococcus sp.]
MKKLFSSVAVFFTLFLTACSAPMKTTEKRQNNLNCAFNSNVTITLDKLTAEGVIKRFGDNQWEIEFESPNTLSGVNLAFNEGTVDASYKGLSFSVPKSALPVKAMLTNLIEAVDTNARADELKGSENDEGMFEISGSLEGGEYVLTVDSSGYIASFDMPNNLLEMSFSDIQPMTGISAPAQESAETTIVQEVTETTTAVEVETTTAVE